MTSVLAQQLQALGKSGVSLPRGKGRPSLLFEAHQAADIDLQTIYEIALQGLVELCQVDDSLKPFLNTLFRRDRVGLEREHQNKAMNEKMDQSVTGFLTLLSRHFLKDAATKVLEFLIRQYRVNETNVSALMSCALPYHSTLQFVRLAQTMRLDGLWTFLAPMQQSGAPLPRSTLVQRCCNDAALLQFVCQAAQQAASPAWLSFYGVVVCEVIAVVPKVTEDAIAQLLPFVLEGLKGSSPKEQRMATYMIVMQLIAKSTPAPQLFNVLCVEVAKGAKEGPTGLCLLVLTGLLKSQGGHASLPPKTLKHIMRLPHLLDDLSAKNKQMGPLLRSLLSSLLGNRDNAGACKKLIQDLITRVPMAEHAEAAASQLLSALQTATEEELPGMQQTMRALDVRYPSQVDAAVNKALEPLAKNKKGDAAKGSSGGDEESVKKAKKVLEFVTGALDKRSARMPLPDASTTLAHAIDAPSAELRRTAVMQLGKSADAENGEEDYWATDVLLRRLADDDAGVVNAVLDSPLLMSIPAAALFDGLSSTLQRATAILRSASSDKAGARGIARKVLKLLAGPFLGVHAVYQQQRIIVLLLDHVIILPAQRKLSMAALKALKKQDVPALSGLHSVDAELPEKSPTKPANAASDNSNADYDHNRKVIAAIAHGLQGHRDAEGVVALATAGHAAAQHVLLLALCHACSEAAERGSAAAGAILRILLNDPGALSTNAAAELENIPAQLSDDGLPSEEHFHSLATNPQDTHRALQRLSLLVALQHASPAVLEQCAQGPHALFHLIASLSPAQAYDGHLCALVDTVAMQISPAAFLSDIFGRHRTDGTDGSNIQVRALDLLRSRYSVPRKAHKAADATAVFHTVLPRLLAAISSPQRPVRTAALAALPAAVANIYGSHAKGTLTQAHLAELVAAITQHRDVFEADPGALASSLCSALQHAQHAGPARGTKGAKRGKPSKADAGDKRSSLSLSAAAATAVAEYFLAVLPEQHGESGAPAALLLLHSIDTSANAFAALRVGSLLLSRYVAHKVEASEQQLMRELLGLFTPNALAGLAEQHDAPKHSHNPVDIFLCILALQPTDAEAERSITSMRHLALSRLSAALYAAIPADRQVQLLLAVLHASSSDPDEACRAAAQRALADAPVAAAVLQNILSIYPSAPAVTPAKKARAAKSAENGGQASASLDNCIAALELLQWKVNIVDDAQLIGTLSSLLPHLLAISNEAVPGDDTSEDTPSRSVAAGYGLQLALTGLQLVVTRHAQEGAADNVDLQAVLECARHAPNSMARTAALTLLAQLASVLPRSTLEHVVEAVTAQASTSGQDADAVSVEASARVLRAFASAWVAAGHVESELIRLVVRASQGAPAQSRLPLLTALSAPLPSVTALQSICIVLLELGVQSSKGDEGDEEPWLSTAADMVGKVAWETGAQAFQGMLEECVQEDKSADLQAATLRFIADQVATLTENSVNALDTPLRQALTHLMQSATSKLQQASEGEVEGALTALLGALEHAMPAADYLKGLVTLTQHDNQALRRRALRLFTSRMDSLHSGQQEHQEGAAAEAASSTAAEAGAAVAEQLPRLLGADQTAGVRQAVLLALSSVVRACGREHPDLVLAALPSALAATTDAQRPVRSSALATVAACAAALGTRSLPQLVPLVTAVLSAVETAGNALTAAEEAQPEQAEALDADEERRRSGATAEALHVEAASALAALDALAAGMGAFLAPYLPRVLALVLQRSILACCAPQVAATASHAWRVLASAIPPRLLLPPLFAQLNPALQGGAVPARALLQMVERAVAAMQPATAAAHADSLFGFLQQALDVRQRGDVSAADADAVERAATATLVAATMKLSEKQFKPLFLRLLAWASTPPAGQPDVQPLGRQAVLYGVIYALTERLRSVFVPYFRYVMDGAIVLLAGQAGDASQPKKKRKKSKALEPIGDAAAADAGAALTTWLLQFRVLQSVRACFQYDSVQFVDEDLFRRLLPALVAQLGAFPPPDVLPLLAANEDASLAPAGGTNGSAMWRAQDSAYGRAIVTALVELAVSCGSDTLWKPFNDKVWKRAMQSEVPMERSRALAVIHAFVDRVREDWSFLIGESVMPFSEIAEVTDSLLQAQTKQLRDMILDITGEDMYELSKIS